MNVKILLLILSLIAIFISGCNTGGSLTSTTAPLRNVEDSVSYYWGFSYGKQLASFNIDVKREALLAGINAALSGEELDDPQTVAEFVNGYMEKNNQRIAQENLKKGQEFLEKNAKKSGVDTLANGVQYKVEKTGNGPKPEPTDVVKVNYTGKHLDGKVFDTNSKTGQPFQTYVNRGIIEGWSIALQEMPVGSKWTVYIPSNMAYGPRGGGPIGPNETLIFEIELLEIVTPETETQQ